MNTISERLEELRAAVQAESISMSELHELQGLAEHIAPDDVELLEAAGCAEFPELREFVMTATVVVVGFTPEDAIRDYVADVDIAEAFEVDVEESNR